MARLAQVNVTEGHVAVLARVVDRLPRGTAPDGTKYRGVFLNAVVGKWRESCTLAKLEVLPKGANCDYERPCGHCGREQFDLTCDRAEAEGLIVRIAKSGKVSRENGRVTGRGKGSVRFYRPGENLPGAGSISAAEIIEGLF